MPGTILRWVGGGLALAFILTAVLTVSSAWANQQVEMEQLKKQLTQAEAERDVLITALGAGVSDCPYLTFWDDGADLEIPDWCTCSDTDEYGFECNVDAKDCWLKYAQQQAERRG